MRIYVRAKTLIDDKFTVTYSNHYQREDPEELSYIDEFISEMIKDIPVYLIHSMMHSVTTITFTFGVETHSIKVKLNDYR